MDIDLRDIARDYQAKVGTIWSKSETGFEISTANTKVRRPPANNDFLGIRKEKPLQDVFDESSNQNVTESNPLLGGPDA